MQARCGHCQHKLFDTNLVKLDQTTFPKHIHNSDIPVVVDFWADWCAPCKMMEPIFEQAASDMAPKVRFAKVDTDANQHLAGQYNIRGIPTIIVFKNGQEMGRQAGAMDVNSLVTWISQTI
jgi:thioredoxin 2